MPLAVDYEVSLFAAGARFGAHAAGFNDDIRINPRGCFMTLPACCARGNMRYIVYLLLVANVLYPAWKLSRDTTVAQNEMSFPPVQGAVRSLVSLKEIAGNTVPESDEKKAATADAYEGQDAEKGNTAVIAQTEQPDSSQAHLCKALGPFDKLAAAEAVSDRLVRMGLIPMLRSVDGQVVDDYWVYLPGHGLQYSRKVLQELKAKNINDYYVYDSKDYLISVGTFKRIGLAERRLAMLQQMGLDAILEKRYKSRVEHWLEMYFEGEYDEQLESIAMETPGLHVNTNSCMSLAAR